MNLKKTEYCEECERDVYLNWNAEKDGYWCYCPYCGKKLMLCHYCHDIEGRDECDRDRYGNCRHSSENKIRTAEEMHKPIGVRSVNGLTKDQRENRIDYLTALIDDCEDCIKSCKIYIKDLRNYK